MFYQGNPKHLRDFMLLTHVDIVEMLTATNHEAMRTKQLKEMAKGVYTAPQPHYDQQLLENYRDQYPNVQDLWNYIFQHIKLCEPGNPWRPVEDAIMEIIEHRYSELQHRYRLAISLLEGRDRESMTHIAALYGKPDQATFSLAERHVDSFTRAIKSDRRRKTQEPEAFGAKQIAATFQRVLRAYGLGDHWNARISNEVSYIDVRPDTNMVFIPDGHQVSEHKLTKLVGHEIESHVLGIENTRQLLRTLMMGNDSLCTLIPWLANSSDPTASEGAAKISDVSIEANHVGRGSTELPTPWYVLGMQYCSTHDFPDTLKWMESQLRSTGYTSEEARQLAWKYVYRITRGCTDFQTPGFVYTKDMAYLKGYFAIQAMEPGLATFTKNFNSLSLSECQKLYEALRGLESADFVTFLLTPAHKQLYLATSEAPLES